MVDIVVKNDGNIDPYLEEYMQKFTSALDAFLHEHFKNNPYEGVSKYIASLMFPISNENNPSCSMDYQVQRKNKAKKADRTYSDVITAVEKIADDYSLFTSIHDLDEFIIDSLFTRVCEDEKDFNLYSPEEIAPIFYDNSGFDTNYRCFCLTSKDTSKILVIAYNQEEKHILINTEMFEPDDANNLAQKYFKKSV